MNAAATNLSSNGSGPMETPGPGELWPLSFGEAYCRVYGCGAAEFEREIFWRSMRRLILPIAALVFWCNRSFFKEDFEAIRELAAARTAAAFNFDVNLLYARNLRHGGWLRNALGLRISGKRLLRIRNEVWHRWA